VVTEGRVPHDSLAERAGNPQREKQALNAPGWRPDTAQQSSRLLPAGLDSAHVAAEAKPFIGHPHHDSERRAVRDVGRK
jgi:hypothetical protein